MPKEKDRTLNSLVPTESRSLAQYSSKLAGRGLELAQKLLTKPVRLLVVDDIPETRENVRKLLFFEDNIQIVGYGENGVEAIDQFESLRPDVMIMCICMPVMDGITATAEICKRHPDAKTIIMSVQNAIDYRRRLFSAGAKAYLEKPFSGEELASAIRDVARGGVHPSRLVYDPESLRKYYAHSGVIIDGLIDTLVSLNERIADGPSEMEVRAFLRDVWHYDTFYAWDYRDRIQITLETFLRTDLQTEIENIWRTQIEPRLDELEKYFHQHGRYRDFRWDNVKPEILRPPIPKVSTNEPT